jgi:hypothetical protein
VSSVLFIVVGIKPGKVLFSGFGIIDFSRDNSPVVLHQLPKIYHQYTELGKRVFLTKNLTRAEIIALIKESQHIDFVLYLSTLSSLKSVQSAAEIKLKKLNG